jgi:iron(III) transport system ATP-binding protein
VSTLELRAVCKSYGAVAAVDNVVLCVEAGSHTVIVGDSGSGKTTLLRVIAGFEAPDSGSVILNGKVLADGSNAIPAHRRAIGFVPQDGALCPHLTVAANIGFGLAGDSTAREQRVLELMDMVALERGLLKRWPHELSGGQQQRVALARALAQRPQLMLLDEPFSALDTGLRAATRKAVAHLLSATGVTTILVTHDQAEALSFADQLAVMRNGRLVQTGTSMDVYLRPIDEATAVFLGDALVLPARLENGWAECALGRIPVDDHSRNGAAQIMVRPEQLHLTEIPAGGGGLQGCFGVVTEMDFSGSACTLTVRLMHTAAGNGNAPFASILVRTTSIQAPAVGATVQITVRGSAHIFNAPVAGQST